VPDVHLCDFRAVPDKTECLEAVWSQGRSCRRCSKAGCYRRGWSKAMVDGDNRRVRKEATDG